MSKNTTLRMEQAQRIKDVRGSVADIECLSCHITQTVERDEDGASIEQWPCEGSDACTKMLCRLCRVVCGRCGQSTCSEHLAILDGELMCEICRGGLKGELECEHPEAYEERWDNGIDPETGYDDSGCRMVCRVCGQEVG